MTASYIEFKLLRDQRGASAVLIALLLVVLLGIAALAIDLGYLYVTRYELQNVADSAALAAFYVTSNGDKLCTLDMLTSSQFYRSGSKRTQSHCRSPVNAFCHSEACESLSQRSLAGGRREVETDDGFSNTLIAIELQ